MSYRCQLCESAVPSNVSLIRKVVETRKVEYKNKEGEVVGAGTEIVKELRLCSSCAKPEAEITMVEGIFTRKAALPKLVKVEKPEPVFEGKSSRQRRKKEAA